MELTPARKGANVLTSGINRAMKMVFPPVEIFYSHQVRKFFPENFYPDVVSDPVVEGIAGDPGKTEEADEPEEV
jgi:hypothetical protein